MNKTARGRRPGGGSDSRQAVLDAAHRLFLAEGYQSVTMRSIAAEAGVDVALVSYYFGSKQALFGAAMRLAANPAEVIGEVLRGGRADLAQRLLRALVTTWDDPARGGPLRTLVGAAGQEPGVARLLREMFERELIGPLAETVGGRDAQARAAFVAAQLSGLVFSRYVLEIEPVAAADADDVVRLLGPALEQILEPSARNAR